MNICLHANFKFGGVTVLAVQLFNKIKRKKEKTKNMKNMFRCISQMLCQNIFIFGFFLYVLNIDVTRNGNNLKLKVKSEFSLSMVLMVINHSNPYIHSTTVLCDNMSLSRIVETAMMSKCVATASLLYYL